MLGPLTPDSAVVWVVCHQAAELSIEVLPTSGPGAGAWTAAVAGDGRALRLETRPPHHIARARIARLQPDTVYRYRVVDSTGRPQHPGIDAAFRTAPRLGTARSLRVVAGSCASAWGPDPSQPIFRRIAARRPELFLWLGDNTYFSKLEREWEDPTAMARRWRSARSMPSLQPLLANCSHLSIWDDHDFGPNDSDRTYALRRQSQQLFRAWWPNPRREEEGDGIHFRHRHGQVEFFLLDTRFFRDPNSEPPGPDKQLLGEAQWLWLEHALRDSQADFKIIASGMQVLSDYHRFETWGLFPQERRRLLDLLARHRIPGVVLLSGDRHFGEVLVDRGNLDYPLYEITTSPLAAGIGELVPDEDAPERVAGTRVGEENFVELDFRWPEPGATAPASLRVQFFNVHGQPRGRAMELFLSELQPAPQ